MQYRIEAKLMGDGAAEWGLFIEINGIWLLHQSYRTRKEAEEAVKRIANGLLSKNDKGGISDI